MGVVKYYDRWLHMRGIHVCDGEFATNNTNLLLWVEYKKCGGGVHVLCYWAGLLVDVPGHLVYQFGSKSRTSVPSQIIWCCCSRACFARAEACVSTFNTALLCSFTVHTRERPDCPTCVFVQFLQEILYTTPFRLSSVTGSFSLTKSWQKIWFGLNVTQISSFPRTLLMVFDRPWMYIW